MKKNNKVLILGASSGIGKEVVKVMLNKNYQVIAHYFKNGRVLKKIKNKNLKLFKFDLTKIRNFEVFFKKKTKLFKDVSIYISLTGYMKLQTFEKVSLKNLNDHINANYLSNIIPLKFLLKRMALKNFGRIVMSSSIGTKFGGAINNYPYSLSKFMNQFFPSIFKKYISKNVLVNILQIGLTDTKMNFVDKNKNLKERIKKIPLKRMGKPHEVANYIYFLSSAQNKLIANQIINISGGE